MSRLLRLCPVLCCVLLAAARAEISEKRLELLFRPALGERMALSPDGRYLAFTEHAGSDLVINISDLDAPGKFRRIIADEDRPILHAKERIRTRLRFLAWTDEQQLVFAPEIEEVPRRVIAPIQVVNADGTNPRLLADSPDFQEEIVMVNPGEGLAATPFHMPRLNVLGFEAGGHRALLVEAPGLAGRPGVTLDIATKVLRIEVNSGRISTLHTEAPGGGLVYDRSGRARLFRDRDAASGKSAFLYRTSDSERWRKLTGPGGELARFESTPEKSFDARSVPLGFDFDANVLLFASDAGRDTMGVYGLDLRTLRRTSLSLEHPHRDLVRSDVTGASPALVFDDWRQRFVGVRGRAPRAFTVWLDEELAGIQRELEASFPRRSVQIAEWDRERSRFIVTVDGGSDPGRVFLYRRGDQLTTELMRLAPWLPAAELNESRFDEFDGPDGAVLSAFVTLPRAPRLRPPPVLLWFASGLPPSPHPEFDAQAQVLADMGFIVCRLNQRGVLGTGRRGQDSLRRDPNGVAAADALATVEWLARRQAIDRKRVATLGAGFAGYLAIRVAEANPAVFRCAVAFDPVLDFERRLAPVAVDRGTPLTSGTGEQAWIASGGPTYRQRAERAYFAGTGAALGQLSLANDTLTVPVFVAARLVLEEDDVALATGLARLRSQLLRGEVAFMRVDYADDFAQGAPAARARVYRQLEEFFNLNLYNYNVKVGPTRVVR